MWIACFLVDDLHALGLWITLMYGVGKSGRPEQTLTMACYGLEVVREALALLRVKGRREIWGKRHWTKDR